jgi:hypothetical protein
MQLHAHVLALVASVLWETNLLPIYRIEDIGHGDKEMSKKCPTEESDLCCSLSTDLS